MSAVTHARTSARPAVTGLKSPPNRVNLTDQVIRRSPPLDKPYRIWDTKVPGLVVRVLPSGVKSFVVQWKRTTSKAIGKFPGMTLETARTRALDILSDAAKHGTPDVAKRRPKVATLRQFLDGDLEPWAVAHQKWGASSVKRIKTAFPDRLDKPMADPQWPWIAEKWRSQRLKAGIAEATVNRELGLIKTALAKAVEWGALATNPLTPVKLRAVDNARVRYLTPDEERRLRDALEQRDWAGIAARERSNEGMRARSRALLPTLPRGGFCDYLTPIVLTAVNTGLRRGELVALEWPDVNLSAKRLHVRAAAAKSGKARYVPLNKEAGDVLARWQRQTSSTGRVFSVRHVRTAWEGLRKSAAIDGFHFHDLRHTFASKLVMAGVDLNTVRELLGHADLKMTLRYSHLAQEHKQSAVEKLTAVRR